MGKSKPIVENMKKTSEDNVFAILKNIETGITEKINLKGEK